MNTAYYREGNKISSVEKNEDRGPKEVLKFDSTNKAKKESRKMQLAHGGLGRGYVMNLSSNDKEYKPKMKSVSDEQVQEAMVDIFRGSLSLGKKLREEIKEEQEVVSDNITYFHSRRMAREYTILFEGKVIDNGIDSGKGKRWAVINKD